MPQPTPRLGLPVPLPGDPPDAPGQLYAFGMALDALLGAHEPATFMNLSAGVNFDSSAGLNKVIVLGDLRIVAVSLYRAAGGAVLGNGFAQMNVGHRPPSPTDTGCIVYDAGDQEVGVATITPDGGISVTQRVGDANNDGAFGGLRATFVYTVA